MLKFDVSNAVNVMRHYCELRCLTLATPFTHSSPPYAFMHNEEHAEIEGVVASKADVASDSQSI